MEFDIEYIAEDGSERREYFVKFSSNSLCCENVENKKIRLFR